MSNRLTDAEIEAVMNARPGAVRIGRDLCAAGVAEGALSAKLDMFVLDETGRRAAIAGYFFDQYITEVTDGPAGAGTAE